MVSESLSFNTALITGGAGGIGKAIASHLLSIGKKVLIAGRTESNLAATHAELKTHGYYVLDTGNISSISSFISRIVAEHPDLDCLINNAGVQRPLDINDEKLSTEEFLRKADEEININIRGPLHLSLGLLPHFLESEGGGVIMNVSSTLGFIPFSVINPVYNGTKAWLHMFSVNLRSQLLKYQKSHPEKAQKGKIRIIEIAPPSVTTDLHREREDPRDNTKEKNPIAMNLEEFMEDLIEGWENGVETIGAGPSKGVVKKWDEVFGENYRKREREYLES